MPTGWTHMIICSIYKKKEDKLKCNNYGRISLLAVVNKISATIIADRIKPYVEEVLGEYQAVFRSRRSTIDHIYWL